MEDFDFTFNPSIPRARVHELAACHFIRQKRDAFLIGPPGVGKTHLAQAIGAEAIRAGFHVLYRSIFDLASDMPTNATPADNARLQRLLLKPDLLIIDDMGLKNLPARSGEILLEIIMRRHENREIGPRHTRTRRDHPTSRQPNRPPIRIREVVFSGWYLLPLYHLLIYRVPLMAQELHG